MATYTQNWKEVQSIYVPYRIITIITIIIITKMDDNAFQELFSFFFTDWLVYHKYTVETSSYQVEGLVCLHADHKSNQ
jgi:hypothetical protein